MHGLNLTFKAQILSFLIINQQIRINHFCSLLHVWITINFQRIDNSLFFHNFSITQ